MILLVFFLFFVSDALHGLKRLHDGDQCYYPGICKPPQTKFSVVAPTTSRKQWPYSGGYCGSNSIQTNALAFGAWISQKEVRASTVPGGGHGNEILHTNIDKALQNLGLDYEAWDWKSQPQPQYKMFTGWMKEHLCSGHPIVWFVYCKGDSHDAYGLGKYDHVEPVYGIYSNHQCEGDTVYDDDWLVHASDWDHNGYYRKLIDLADTPAMNTTCKNADGRGGGPNEAFPCIPKMIDYGYAIKGIVDPKKVSLPLSLAVNSWDEPYEGSKPLYGTTTVRDLTKGSYYTIYRYGSYKDVPKDSDFEKGYHSKFNFKATATTYTHKHTVPFWSNGSTYFVAVKSNKIESSLNTSSFPLVGVSMH